MKDSFDRDADNEYDYNCFEREYIFKNMRPDHISVWEWRVMFERLELHTDRALAVADAKAMAKDMGCVTIVRKSTYYKAYPADYWTDATHLSLKYENKRIEFTRNLVINDQYPDIVKIADEENHPNSWGISSHYSYRTIYMHREWKEEARSSSDSPTEPDSDSRSL